MIIKEIQAKNILSKSKVYDWTINPYIGCEHSCTYCYARFMKRFSGHKENWGEFVDVKINAPELLSQEIKKKKKGKVWISGVTDCYQPIEKKYELTKKCLEILQENNWPVTIQTKSPLVLRELELLKKFQEIEVGFTITTADEEIRKIFEPRTAPISERIEALDKLHQAGIKTFAMIAPLLPKAEGLVSKLKGKVDYVIIDKMNYHYADWIYKKYNLEKIQKGNELANHFKKENIPCRIIF
ncbi:MAG: radical SAM protein [Candidatus Parcubacteria bacterium]|nr:radical SAM protein [Candidatus Parcubacteria bacterium]